MYRARLSALTLALLSVSACDRSGNAGPGTIAQWPTGTTTSDTSSGPEPKFDYDSTNGCSDFIVYQTNKDRSEALVVIADDDKLGIKDGVTNLDLATARLDLSVKVRVYPRPQKHIHLCTDFLDPDSDEPIVWEAAEGKLTVERFPPDRKPEGKPKTYRVRLTLVDA